MRELLRLTRLDAAFSAGGEGRLSMSAERTLMYEFVSEAKEHLANIADDLLALEQGKDDSAALPHRPPFPLRSLRQGRRPASSAAAPSRTSPTPWRRSSTMLAVARTPRSPAVIDALLAGADRIQALLDDVERSNDADVADLLGPPSRPAAGRRLPAGHSPRSAAGRPRRPFRAAEPPWANARRTTATSTAWESIWRSASASTAWTPLAVIRAAAGGRRPPQRRPRRRRRRPRGRPAAGPV